ncbi:3'-5' exonuclease [Nitrosomonas sp. Nm132]|uniref:3'-5' exonuclease n=1 Tax=Nitrosomonas sp. Nm132 TaxID=1881053 RepID=UPI00088339CA|nr:3'-5' exonuclease [Nitrosomonas sp. Nm132]SDH25319.1 exodeoxyribonuclease X [Nitrosomonas sp. Nm132]
MSKAIIFDTETTGINDPEIVEAAWIEIADLASLDVVNVFHERYKPSKPIQLSAMAVHHIMDEDLVDCPPSSTFQLPDGVEYLIGHNVDFDWTAIGNPDVKRICTLALSRSLWPELESHNQSSMIYFLHRSIARDLCMHAHSARADVDGNRLLLMSILKDKLKNVSSWEELWLCSEEARIPKVMPFGRHRGTPIKDVPPDYRAWLLKQPDVDQYLIKALTQ